MPPLIEILSLSKTYRHTAALRDISLSIKKKEIFGIIGLSGAGKSTLIRCLARLIEPTSGRIFFENQDISHLKGALLRSFHLKMGMIFQHFNLLSSRTVAGNISYPLEIARVPKEEREKRIDELLDLVGLSLKRNSYPASLSGGEKQRVGIARALANHPEVLLCDEATSALDPRTTQEILALLQSINQKLGVTIVLITHDMTVIKKICHKVAVIHDGTLVEQGPVAEVFSAPTHSITQQFIQGTTHSIPEEFFKPPSPNRKLLRLQFTGAVAGEPLISQIVKKYQVDANILLGWIDHLQTTTVGTLIIELIGSPEGIDLTLVYLTENGVHYEVLKPHES